MTDFDVWWKIYPHWSTRSKKALSKALWDNITGGGHSGSASVDGSRVKLTLQATPEELITGAKAYRMATEEQKYVAGAQVWLNQGRWLDHDDADDLAARWDRIQDHMKEMEAKGNVVPLSG